MRVQIAKNVKRHSKAIQNAVKRYNETSAALNLPKPSVEWDQVTHYKFLQDFTLLQDVRPEVLCKKWASNAVQYAIKQHQQVMHAQEEIIRCEVKACRTFTCILDECCYLDQQLLIV